MSNLFASLNNASQSLSSLDRLLTVTQNNVNNVATPGFAKQRITLESLGGLGGVKAGSLETSRSLYAEGDVQRQSGAGGFESARLTNLKGVEAIFDISGKTGIPASLQNLLNSFSAWSVSPNSTDARQAVMVSAESVASSFRQAGTQLGNAAQDTESQIRDTVGQINSLASTLRDLNIERRGLSGSDPGLDARVHATLEELSGLVNFDPIYQADGTVTVLAGGQQPLVIGDQVNALQVKTTGNGSGLSHIAISGSDGVDLSGSINSGSLGGLLQVRNQVLPSLLGDANQTGELNRLAQQFATRVNDILTSAQIAGPPVEAGKPLFVVNSDPTLAAKSFAVNPDLTAATLAAIDPGPPEVSNGAALKLSALNQSSNPADQLDGASYLQFFAQLASSVGRQVASAESGESRQKDLIDQAKALRSSLSGVSLDEEAVRLTEIQRSYQACARMVTVIDEISQTLLAMGS